MRVTGWVGVAGQAGVHDVVPHVGLFRRVLLVLVVRRMFISLVSLGVLGTETAPMTEVVVIVAWCVGSCHLHYGPRCPDITLRLGNITDAWGFGILETVPRSEPKIWFLILTASERVSPCRNRCPKRLFIFMLNAHHPQLPLASPAGLETLCFFTQHLSQLEMPNQSSHASEVNPEKMEGDICVPSSAKNRIIQADLGYWFASKPQRD